MVERLPYWCVLKILVELEGFIYLTGVLYNRYGTGEERVSTLSKSECHQDSLTKKAKAYREHSGKLEQEERQIRHFHILCILETLSANIIEGSQAVWPRFFCA